MKISECLREMEKLLSDPERWTIGTGGRDVNGTPTYCDSPNAVSWCLLGAAEYCSPKDSTMLPYKVRGFILRATNADSVSVFNDTHTHAEVLQAIRDAAALAESEGQ